MTSYRKRLTREKGWRNRREKRRKKETRSPTPPGSPANSVCVEPSIPLSPLISTLKKHVRKCRNENMKRNTELMLTSEMPSTFVEPLSDDYPASPALPAQNGSPAGVALVRGDIIRKIQEFDARDLRHQDALNLFQTAGDTISLVVQRDNTSRRPVPATSPFATAVSPIPHAPLSPLSPLRTFTPPPGLFSASSSDELIPITKQPYRTTPLVLPGAKVKKEDNVTECYLRHHPNPMMRAHPVHTEYFPADVAMKQKVADTVLQRVIPPDPTGHRHVVNRQFNTPIGLYSEQNIVDTIHKQHGPGATMKPTVVYDPAKSETYKALQDLELGDTVHEVTVPPQPKVFAPKLHSPTSKVHQKTVATAPHPYSHLNPMGHSQEKIQQSGSFNRLMWMVKNDY